MALVMMVFTPLVSVFGAWLGRISQERAKAEQTTYAEAAAIAEETFSSIRTVQALNGCKQELARCLFPFTHLCRYEVALEKGRKEGLVKYFYAGICIGGGYFFTYASYAVAFW